MYDIALTGEAEVAAVVVLHHVMDFAVGVDHSVVLGVVVAETIRADMEVVVQVKKGTGEAHTSENCRLVIIAGKYLFLDTRDLFAWGMLCF